MVSGVMIRVEDVRVEYESKKVLDGVDLEIGGGEFVSLVGQTGCGKSTLLRLILAEEAPHCRISVSSDVLPVIREYPRLSTTVIDAYVGPRIANYLTSLEKRLDARGVATPQKFLMQSNGGLMRISLGARL